jgi:hypothetical protein
MVIFRDRGGELFERIFTEENNKTKRFLKDGWVRTCLPNKAFVIVPKKIRFGEEFTLEGIIEGQRAICPYGSIQSTTLMYSRQAYGAEETPERENVLIPEGGLMPRYVPNFTIDRVIVHLVCGYEPWAQPTPSRNAWRGNNYTFVLPAKRGAVNVSRKIRTALRYTKNNNKQLASK